MDNQADFTVYPDRLAPGSEDVTEGDDLSPQPTMVSNALARSLHPASTVRERNLSEQPLDGRLALTLIDPPGFLGTTDPIQPSRSSHNIPPFMQCLLCQLSPSHAELQCVPQTPEIDTLLADIFPHEFIQPYNRFPIEDPNRYPAALATVHSAIAIHRKALYNSRNAEDAYAWHPIVRQILCGAAGGSQIVGMDVPDMMRTDDDDYLQVVDTSAKTISASLPPAVDIKIDMVLVFNIRLENCGRRALHTGVRMNVFCDPNFVGKLVVLGCTVHTPTGPQLDAQYQLGVFGMKTLHLTRALARRRGIVGPTATHIAVGLDVCGHVWSLHLTYWSNDGALVTHGPVFLGSTDTLVGTLKLLRWMWLFQSWSDDVWDGWVALLNGVTDPR